MFDIRVYLSLKNIADNLDFLNLEQLVIFNQLSSLSGLLHFLNKCSHSLKYLTLETFHLKDLDSDLMQPLAFPKLRKLKITSMGNTRFHGIKDLGNLQSLILESTEAIKGITLVELLEQCGSSLRELEISSLASRVPLTPQAELPNLKRLKFCKVDIFPSGQHYDEVLKLIQKCSPSLEKLTLQGRTAYCLQSQCILSLNIFFIKGCSSIIHIIGSSFPRFHFVIRYTLILPEAGDIC